MESGGEWQDWIVDDKIDQELKLSYKNKNLTKGKN